MNWAPCSLAWWAYCSCFWIIDSLSPVQVACSSAPRTILDISPSFLELAASRERTPSLAATGGSARLPRLLPRRAPRIEECHGDSPATPAPCHGRRRRPRIRRSPGGLLERCCAWHERRARYEHRGERGHECRCELAPIRLRNVAAGRRIGQANGGPDPDRLEGH